MYLKYLYTIKFYFKYIVLLFLIKKSKHNYKKNKISLLTKKIQKQTNININKIINLIIQIANLFIKLGSLIVKEKKFIFNIISLNINITIKLIQNIIIKLVKYITNYYI